MRSLTSRGLLSGSIFVACALMIGCEDGLALLEELKQHKGGGGAPGKPPGEPGPQDEPCVSPPGGGPACTGQALGDEKTCKDIGAWKQAAWESCQAAGLELTDYTPYGGCGEAGAGFQFVKFTCCGSAPPPPPATCESQLQGGDTSCKPTAIWKQYASEACEEMGFALADYSPFEACGDDSYRMVKYTCCK
jgi:hypothetical protein